MRMIALILFMLSAGCATTPDAASFDAVGGSPRAEGYTHYLAGVYYQRNGRIEDAAREYRKASDLLPDSLSLHIRLIQFFIDIQDFENAEVMCKRMLDKVPNDASLWIILATLYQQQGNNEGAADAIAKAVEFKPDSLEDFEGLLRVLDAANDRITTIDLLQKLTELIPTSPQLYLRLGISLARIGNQKEAQQALERALELDPSLVQARSILGLVYLEQDKNAEAAEQFRLYLEKTPTEDSTREYLAGALARTHQYADATSEVQRISSEGEMTTERTLGLMYLLIRSGKLDQAKALVPPNDAPIIGTLFRAIARKAAGDAYRPLLDSLDQVEGDLDTECTQYLNAMLSMFGDQDMGDYLLAEFKAMRDEGVRSRTLNIVEARILMGLERDPQAAEVLEATLRDYGPDKWIHFYLGTVYEAMDRFKDSEKHLKECLKIDPADTETMNNLAYMYAEHGVKLDEAERLLKNALKTNPNSGYYLDSLGWVYYQKGKADLAVEYIRRAILAMDRDDAVLRDHLGDAYLLKGDVDKALGEWRRARRLDPSLEGVQEKIDKRTKDN